MMSFVPTRDLPQWRPPPSLSEIAAGLARLSDAFGLGRDQEVHLGVLEDVTNPCADVSYDEGGRIEDEIETRYVHSWLTKLISTPSLQEQAALQDKAAEVLAALCGNPALAETVTAFVFAPRLRVRIRDLPITSDALGKRTWGSAPLLARRLVGKFHEAERGTRLAQGSNLKVLELGAGTGLVGLALAVAASSSQQQMQVDLTDYHPHVLTNLTGNVKLNDVDHTHFARVSRLDWQAVHEVNESNGHTSVATPYVSTAQTLPRDSSIGDGSYSLKLQPFKDLDVNENCYDVVIAADCVYDPFHPIWIRSVAQRYLRQRTDLPKKASDGFLGSRSQGGVLYLTSPFRTTHRAEMDAIYAAFPLQESVAANAGSHATANSSAVPLASVGRVGREPELCIVSQVDEIGYDNFGPQELKWDKNQGTSSPQRGLETTYRTFEIRWT